MAKNNVISYKEWQKKKKEYTKEMPVQINSAKKTEQKAKPATTGKTTTTVKKEPAKTTSQKTSVKIDDAASRLLGKTSTRTAKSKRDDRIDSLLKIGKEEPLGKAASSNAKRNDLLSDSNRYKYASAQNSVVNQTGRTAGTGWAGNTGNTYRVNNAARMNKSGTNALDAVRDILNRNTNNNKTNGNTYDEFREKEEKRSNGGGGSARPQSGVNIIDAAGSILGKSANQNKAAGAVTASTGRQTTAPATGKTQQKKDMLDRPYNELALQKQMEDPNSRLNQTYRNERLRRDYGKYKQNEIAEEEDLLQRALNDPATWLGGYSDTTKEALKYENASKYAKDKWNARQQGLNDASGDIGDLNAEQRGKRKDRIQSGSEALRQQIADNEQLIRQIQEDNDRFNMLNERELYRQYGNAYYEYKRLNGIKDPNYSIIDWQNDIGRQNAQRMQDLLGDNDAIRKQLTNNDKDLEKIEQYDKWDRDYEKYMDPKKYLEREKAEYEDLRRQQEELEASGADQYSLMNIDNQLYEKEQNIREIEEQYGFLLDDEEDDSGYHQEYYNDYAARNSELVNNQTYDTTNVDVIANWIGGGEWYQRWYENDGFERRINDNFSGAEVMTDDEKNQFMKLYNNARANGREPVEAKAFLDALQPYLNERLRPFEELQNTANAAQYPAMMSAMTGLESTVTALPQMVATGIGNLFGMDFVKDPNSDIFAATRASRDTESQVANMLGPVGGFIYKAGMSGYKNLLRGLMYGGLGGAAEAATLTQFFGEAFNQSYVDKLEETKGDAEASGAYALVDAAISTFFEIASIEKMYSDPTDYMQYVIQNVGAEMSEEAFEAIFGPYMHKLLDGSDQWNDRAAQIYDNYIKQGMYQDETGKWHPVLESNKREVARLAQKQAMQEWNKEILENTLSAAISTGGAAAYGGIKNLTNDTRTGNWVLNQNKERGMSRRERSGLQMDNALKLVNPALAMPVDTQSHKLAQQIENDLKEGKKISPKAVGQLTTAIVNESNEQIGKIAQDVLGESFLKTLKTEGVGQKEAADLTERLVRVVTRDVGSTEEMLQDMLIISETPAAQQILAEYGDSEARKRFMQETEAAKTAQKSVMEIITGTKESDITTDTVSGMMAGAKAATAEDIAEANAQGTRSGSALEVIADGIYGDITGFMTENVKGEDGKNQTVVKVQIGTGAAARTVDISQVKGLTDGAAQVLQVIGKDRGQVIGNETAKALLQIAGRTKDLAGTIADSMKIMWSAAMEQKAPATNLDTETQDTLSEAVRADLDAAEKRRIANWRGITPGQGTTTYNGFEYGSKEFNDALAELGETNRKEANVIGSYARSMGVDVQLYFDAKESAKQGAFYGGQDGAGIRINLAGTTNSQGAHRSAVATFAHEVTHNIEANSPTQYKALRSFVLQNMDRSGIDLQGELQHIMDNYEAHGESIDMSGAIAELVAMGSEQVLTNENLAAELKQQDGTLYGKVQHAVNRLIKQIRGIKGDVRTSSSRYARAMMNVSDQMAKIWQAAYEEAKNAEAPEEIEITDKGIRGGEYSLDQYSERQKQNWANSDKIVIYTGLDSLKEFISNSVFDKNYKKKMYFGMVDKNLANTLQHWLNYSIEGYNVALYSDEVIKELDRHGIEDPRTNHVALLDDTFEDILTVMNKPDYVNYSGMYYGNPSFRFEKDMGVKGIVVAYVVKRKHDLHIQSFHEEKTKNKKGNLAQANNANSPTLSTSKTTLGTVPNNNISQTNKQSKGQNSFSDEEYEAAVNREDWKAAEDMLLDKMLKTEGITGYRAPYFYAGEHKDIARLIKSGNQEIIDSIVNDMAKHVPDNAVLVPMPPHEGKVTDTTDTMILAKALSKVTGAPVINALESDYHESRYKAKAAGNRNVNAETMGFRQVKEIPEGMMPVFIDNMVGGGQTAMAARNAIGRGITLAYAQSSRAKSQGVKVVSVTYDQDGNLIPLSQRMDPNNKSWKYSIQNDEDYMDAVNSDDMAAAQRMVDEAANAAMPDSKIRDESGKLIKIYHNTDAEFTEFLPATKGGKTGIAEGYGIYLTDDPDTASNYGKRQIAGYVNITRPAYDNRRTLTRSEVIKLIRAAAEYHADDLELEYEMLGETESRENLLKDTWVSNYANTYGVSSMDKVYAEVADNILKYNDNDQDIVQEIMAGMAIRDYSRAMDFYNRVLTPTTGIDGIWAIWKNEDKGLKANIFLAFDSSQIKEADPVTYDDDGNVIPLSERFDTEKKDIRWSMQDDTDYDIKAWMETVPEWSLRTEAEKELLRKYGSIRRKGQMDQLRMEKIDAEIKRLEGMQGKAATSEGTPVTTVTVDDVLKANGIVQDGAMLKKNGVIIGSLRLGVLSIYDKYKDIRKTLENSGAFEYDEKTASWTAAPQNIHADEERDVKRQLEALRIRKQNLQKVMDQTNEELAKITSDEGFGGMMYRQQQVLNNLAYNKTQAEVRDSIENMEKAAKRVQGIIDENRKKAEELESSDIVKRFRQLLGTTTAAQTARELKKEYSSTWTAKQIQEYLEPIILKIKSGEDFQQDVEELAGILVNSDSRNTYEELEALRGMTITLGKGAQAELKAQNSSMKEVRARLAGTGITVKYGDRSTLEADIEDLRAEYPMIPELGDEKDALNNFLNWIDSMKSASAAGEFYDQRLAEAMAVITGKAAGAAKGIYMPNDPKAQRQVLAMMDFVKGLNAETQQAQDALQQVADEMAAMQKAGREASGKTDVLMRDVNVALDYYNRVSRIAVDEAKQKRTSAIIEQLKSEQAQKIIKNNEEWRALIERDKNAQKQLEENRKAQAQINTSLRRMYNLLQNPKGTKNIPEYMQGLAREVLGIFAKNDADGGRRFLNATKDGLQNMLRVLNAWKEQNGPFNISDLEAMQTDAVVINLVQDLDIIREGIAAINTPVNGKNKLDTLQQRGVTYKNIQEAVSEIYSAIRAEQEVQIGDRRVAVEDAAYKVAKGTQGKNYREWTGKLGGAIRGLHKAIVSGNMTPEYFFRTVGNEGLSDLWDAYHWAENRNGLELAKAQQRLAEIAKQHGYDQWDMGQEIVLPLEGGETKVTLGQLMSLWATWKREKTLGPQMSEHLTKGGFYAEKDLRKGTLGRTTIERKANRVTEADMEKVKNLLMEEQRKFVDDVVLFMSRDMSELGNAASMAAYGIRMYKEKYYFPFQMWDGVKSRKSNDAGSAAAANDRAFHPSFSKSRVHGANNALVLGDFMTTAADHIAGMINYATMGLANETFQKVLNQQTAQGPYETLRNTRAILEEAYGREVMQYLAELQNQLNGGAVRTSRSLGDKAISIFRKNAVAGSLSVALQQPLSYIRAAMLINPKYLTKAAMTEYWKGSYDELMKHSGVAVIKDMGRFDMNAGQSAREYLIPDGKKGKAKQAWDKAAEYATILPEKMDAWTWTRMWVAVKAEQKALNPEMDVKSDEFLDMCGARFNDVMRRTQVYDSVLVRSANMRSDNYWAKSLTSFMAEPTLTLNVLADAVRSAKQGESGGKLLLAKAGATFALSAVMQSLIKALFSSGRTPDEKKTWLENFVYRFTGNIISEGNPLTLIPGYNDLVTLLKDGKLEDDAMGAIGKIFTAYSKTKDLILNGSERGVYRDIEDSAGQLAQIFTNIPVKNIMRDMRAIYNWFLNDTAYANRKTSMNVIKNQTMEALINADNFLSMALQEAGFKTDNKAYYRRIFEAEKKGDKQEAQDLIDYLLTGKGVKDEKTIMSGVTGVIKEEYEEGKLQRTKAEELLRITKPKAEEKEITKTLDKIDYEKKTGESVDSYTNYTPLYDAMDKNDDQKIQQAKDYLVSIGYKDKEITSAMKSRVKEQYKDGEINRANAEELLKKYDPKITTKDIADALDEIDYENRTGESVDSYSNYTPLQDAIEKNNASEASNQIEYLKQIGYKETEINTSIASYIKKQYKEGQITKDEAERKLRTFRPDMSENDVWWEMDRIQYQLDNGLDKAPGGSYYRLWDAMDNNSTEEIRTALNAMTGHGVQAKNIKTQITKQYKDDYLKADSNGKRKIRDAIQKAYKLLGLTAEDADKIINKWGKDKDNSSKSGGGGGGAPTRMMQETDQGNEFWDQMYRHTEGKEYGMGNIDLNHRKVVHNPDGSISTEYSITVGYDDGIYVLPTVINGKIVSEDEAIEHFEKTGEYLGRFDTDEEANDYAWKLHERQEWYYTR